MSEARKSSADGGAGELSEQIHRHPQEIDQEKERLELELIDFLDAASEDSFDVESWEALLAKRRAIEATPDVEAFDTLKKQADFCRRFGPVFDQIEAETQENTAPPKKKKSRFAMRRILLIAAALIVVFGAMITAQAFGFDIFGSIARWTNETFRFQNADTAYVAITMRPLAEGEEKAYETFQEVIDAFGITGPLFPEDIPDYLGNPKISVVNRSGGIYVKVDYVNKSSFLKMRFNESVGNDFGEIEKEAHTGSLFFGGIQHYVLSDLGIEKVTWRIGAIECRASGNLSEEEMENLIKSIYEERE